MLHRIDVRGKEEIRMDLRRKEAMEEMEVHRKEAMEEMEVRRKEAINERHRSNAGIESKDKSVNYSWIGYLVTAIVIINIIYSFITD